MRNIKVLTSCDNARLQDWYDRAQNCVEVRRFLSLGTTCDVPSDLGSDWATLFLMDRRDDGMAKVSPCRAQNALYCDLSVWVLPTAGRRKPLVAGSLIRAAFEAAHFRYGSKYMEWGVHGTNADSLRFSERHATCYGRKSEGAWDSGVGAFVDQYLFRALIADVLS